jgi:chloramphenicol 3-O-phosphotransferase
VTLFDEHAVVLVTGISASGKSTVGEALATRFARGVHVRGDAFRRMVVSGREDMIAQPSAEAVRQLQLRYGIATRVTDAYFDAGFSCVLQDVILGRALQECVDVLRARPLYVVVLCPSVDVVAAREAERDKTGYPAGHHSIAALDQGLRSETPRIGLWLDTSEMSLEETVETIAARAGEAAV